MGRFIGQKTTAEKWIWGTVAVVAVGTRLISHDWGGDSEKSGEERSSYVYDDDLSTTTERTTTTSMASQLDGLIPGGKAADVLSAIQSRLVLTDAELDCVATSVPGDEPAEARQRILEAVVAMKGGGMPPFALSMEAAVAPVLPPDSSSNLFADGALRCVDSKGLVTRAVLESPGFELGQGAEPTSVASCLASEFEQLADADKRAVMLAEVLPGNAALAPAEWVRLKSSDPATNPCLE